DAVAGYAGNPFYRWSLGHVEWDAVVDRIDHAADRLTAVAQRGRPAQHLDLYGCQGIDRDRVVVAEIGSVVPPNTVFGDSDTRGGQSANHREARSRSESRCRDAGN